MRQTGTKDFTPEQRRKIHEIVYTGMLTRRTTEEMQMQIENKVKVAISYNTLKHLRWKIRKEAHQKLLNLKKDNDLFMNKYMEDIDHMNLLIREQWLLHEITENPAVKISCLNSILNYVSTRRRLYNFLPELCAMRPFEDAETVARSDSNFNSRFY